MIIYNLATVSVYIAVPLQLIKSFLSDGIYDVGPEPEDLSLSFLPDDSISKDRIVELRTLLADGDLERLNTALADYQTLFEMDSFNEYKVYDAYRAFETTAPAYETHLNAWKDAFPNHHQPYLALGKYYYAKGWEARGNKFITETSQDQIRGMRTFLARAEEHLNTALAINPKLIVGHNLLIAIHNTLGDDDAEDRSIQQAVALFPDSFIIHSTAEWATTPRWGGDYPAMEAIARKAQADAATNPKLSALYGYVYYDQARRLRHQKKYEKAAELLTRAISYGDHWLFYNERAELYHYYLKDGESARADIDRSLQLRPTLATSYRLQSRIAFADADYDASHDSLQIAERLVPEDSKTQKWRAWASTHLMKRGHPFFKTDIQAAMDMYDRSILFNEENFEAYYWRGVAEYNEQDPDTALADLETAIDINPHHFASYQMIDRVLAGSRQWGQIIGYWNRFLALEPDHAGAHLEIAGTHRHNKDVDQSRIHLEKACELGSQEACRLSTRMGMRSS